MAVNEVLLNGVFHKVINYVLFCLQLLSNINGLISKSLLDKKYICGQKFYL